MNPGDFLPFNNPVSIFESLSESFTSYGLVVSDQMDRIVFWNRGAQNLFKLRAREVMGKSFPSFDNSGGTGCRTFESEIQTKFGEMVPVSVTVSRCRSSDGTFEGNLYIIRDIAKDKLKETLISIIVKLSILINKNEAFPAMMQGMMDAIRQEVHLPLVYCCLTEDQENFFISSYSGKTSSDLELSCHTRGEEAACMSGGCKIACDKGTVACDELKKHHLCPHFEENDMESYFILHVPLMSDGVLTGILHLVVPESLREFYFEQSETLMLISSKISSAITFKRMSDELQSYADNLEKIVKKRTEQLREKDALIIQSGKLATLGEMATGIAHEINQPLGGISLIAQGIRKALDKGILSYEMMVDRLNAIHEQVERINRIINHLRIFGRQAPEYKTAVNINTPLLDVFQLIGQQLVNRGILIDTDLSENLPYVMADSTKLEQVFLNIIGNAKDALDDQEVRVNELKSLENPPEWVKDWKKRITIKTYTRNDKVFAEIQDTAGGIRHHILEKIFEPFFTTKEVGRGTGLGLSISYGIIREFAGEIRVETEIDRGSKFIVVLPVLEEEKSV